MSGAADPRFMGLIHALRSSAEVALGDDDSPLRARADRDGVRGLAAAQRSLHLLEMLQDKTAGNLVEAERDLLWTALRSVRARIETAADRVADEGTDAHELPMAPGPGTDATGGGELP
ncbi:MAG: DUF1844 domain-containing protein [Deinococcales bacterium]